MSEFKGTKGKWETTKYKYCNHHHELTDEHKIVDFGDGEFIANKKAIPLLKALNELGLKTRTHHIGNDNNFLSIILEDNISIEDLIPYNLTLTDNVKI